MTEFFTFCGARFVEASAIIKRVSGLVVRGSKKTAPISLFFSC